MVKFKKSLALLLSLALVVCLAIPGLVLPVSAADATAATPVDLFNGIGDFENEWPTSSAMNDLKNNSTIVTDPAGGTNKVAMIPTQEKADAGDYTTGDIWFQFYNLHNAETGNNNKHLETGKAYKLTFRIYGGKIGMYIMGGGTATMINGQSVNKAGTWMSFGDDSDAWQDCSLYFYIKPETTNLNLNYILNFAKKDNGYANVKKATYIDDVKLVEAKPESVTLDTTSKTMKTGETLTLTASVLPLFSTTEAVTWSTDNAEVASVEAGVVTAKAEGKATITATAGALSATCAITVDNNLLADGDVSNGKTGTWAGMPEVFTDETGNGMIKIPAGTAYSECYYWKKMANLDWEVGATYLITFDAKGDRFRFQVSNCTNVTSTTFDSLMDTTGLQYGAWQRYQTAITINEGYTINGDWAFHFKPYRSDAQAAQNDIYIDNVRIVKMPENLKITEDFNSDVSEFFFWRGLYQEGNTTGLIKSYGATVVADPDDVNNNVLKVPKADTNTAVYFQVPDLGVWDKTELHRYTIRHKGGTYALVNAGAHAKMLQTSSTTGADGWTTTTYVVDIDDEKTNYGYMIGLRLPTNQDLYIDSLSWEHIDNATGITLNKTSAELAIGGTVQLTATEAPVSSYLVDAVTWSSSDATVATVSNTGLVTAKKGGTATITATSGSFTATCSITVVWTKEQFPNGDMEADNHGVSFQYKANNTSGTGFEIGSGYGVNGSVGLKLTETEAKYIYKNDYAMRPNSTYLFSYVACADDFGATLQIGLVAGNCPGVTMYNGGTKNLSGDWTRYYVWLTTGDAPVMNAAYNLYFHPRSLGTSGAASAIYVDNLSLRLIEDGDSILPDLSFEFEDEKFDAIENLMTAVVNDPDNGENKVLELPGTKTNSFDLTQGFPVLDSYAMYEFTFDYKMDQAWIDAGTKMNFYIGTDTVNAEGVVTVRRKGDLEFYDTGALTNTTEWKTKTVTFFTNSMAKMNSNTLYFNVYGTAGNGNCYIDNVTLKRVDSGHSAHATISGGYQTQLSVDGGKTWVTYLKNVEAGTVVDVDVIDHGAQPTVLKSLTARTEDGTVAILNKDVVNGYTDDSFGTGTGRRYQFKMGDSAAQVKATMIAWTTAKDQDTFYLNTVGTSLHQNADGEYDGIRFLTRLQLKKESFDPDAEKITVRYNGKDYEVNKFGSILARKDSLAENEELTLANAKWRTVSYANNEMLAIDYTKSYIDFTVIMKKGASLDQETFNAREYVARGYIELWDIETNESITVYSDSTQTDSVSSVQARM